MKHTLRALAVGVGTGLVLLLFALLFAVAATAQSSHYFLGKLEARDPSSLEQFDKYYGRMGYDVVFASDYYGVKGKTSEQKRALLLRILKNAKKWEEKNGRRPHVVLDIDGWDLNTDPMNRAMAEASEFVHSYHVFDEPDAHPRGPDSFARSPEQIEELMAGTLRLKYGKPCWMVFENQFGRVNNRKWNYKSNTDEAYRRWMRSVAKWVEPDVPCYFGVDFYIWTRASRKVPTDQLGNFLMAQHAADLVASVGLHHYFHNVTETVYQSLGYICKAKTIPTTPISPEQLRAQIWMSWVAGQRGIRSDFNHMWGHLCKGSGHDHEGLLHPYYAKHLRVIVEENERNLGAFFERPNVRGLTTNEMVRTSLRFYQKKGLVRILVMAVNVSSQDRGKVGLLFHPILSQLGDFRELGSNRVVRFSKGGWLADDFGPDQVRLYELEVK